MKNWKNLNSFILLSTLLLSCHKEKEPECSIEEIRTEVTFPSQIIPGTSNDIQVNFLLVGSCENTVDFDCLMVLENLEDSTLLYRDTFLVAGFNGFNSIEEHYKLFWPSTPGSYKFIFCTNFSNKIQELNEHNCQ
jgi:hypothetical protein